MKILPNLELLIYKAQEILVRDTSFIEAMRNKNQTTKFFHPDFSVNVFSQIWENSAAGLDACKNGKPVMSRDVMTEEYTTVVHERTTDTYIVFFGDRPCYKVTHPNEKFIDDMRYHNMASLSKSKVRYADEDN